MLRRIAALPAAVALLLLLVVPAMAGGWAEVRADATTTTEPPIEGQPIEIGFTVLQHGETPAGWVTPTVHFYHLGTGATIDAPATGSGPDGHFVATVRPDTAGYWGWTVTFPELLSDPTAVTIAVHHRDGTAPAFDPGAAVTAVAVARAGVRQEVLDAMYLEVERLTGQLQAQRSSIDRLQAEVDTLTAAGRPLAATRRCRRDRAEHDPARRRRPPGHPRRWRRRVPDGLAGRPERTARDGGGAQSSSALIAPGVSDSRNSRPKRAVRASGGTASSHRRRSAFPSA